MYQIFGIHFRRCSSLWILRPSCCVLSQCVKTYLLLSNIFSRRSSSISSLVLYYSNCYHLHFPQKIQIWLRYLNFPARVWHGLTSMAYSTRSDRRCTFVGASWPRGFFLCGRYNDHLLHFIQLDGFSWNRFANNSSSLMPTSTFGCRWCIIVGSLHIFFCFDHQFL